MAMDPRQAMEYAIGDAFRRIVVLEKKIEFLEEREKAALVRTFAEPADAKSRNGIAPGKGDVAFAIEARKFIMDILSPDMYGYAVSREVRNAARRVLGVDTKE